MSSERVCTITITKKRKSLSCKKYTFEVGENDVGSVPLQIQKRNCEKTERHEKSQLHAANINTE